MRYIPVNILAETMRKPLHVYSMGEGHVMRHDCWCEPECYGGPRQVWIHHSPCDSEEEDWKAQSSPRHTNSEFIPETNNTVH